MQRSTECGARAKSARSPLDHARTSGLPAKSGLAAQVVHRGKCAIIVLLAFHLDGAGFQPQLASRLDRRIALLVRNPVECDPNNRGAWKHFARELDAFGGELDLAATTMRCSRRMVASVEVRPRRSITPVLKKVSVELLTITQPPGLRRRDQWLLPVHERLSDRPWFDRSSRHPPNDARNGDSKEKSNHPVAFRHDRLPSTGRPCSRFGPRM